jgi:hypothetical protein
MDRWIDEPRCTCWSSNAQKMMGGRAGRSGAVGWPLLMVGGLGWSTKEDVLREIDDLGSAAAKDGAVKRRAGTWLGSVVSEW